MITYLQRWADCLHMVQLMPLHPKTASSLASFKSRLVLPFWYRLTQVVAEKRPLSRCSSSSFSIRRCCYFCVVIHCRPDQTGLTATTDQWSFNSTVINRSVEGVGSSMRGWLVVDGWQRPGQHVDEPVVGPEEPIVVEDVVHVRRHHHLQPQRTTVHTAFQWTQPFWIWS